MLCESWLFLSSRPLLFSLLTSHLPVHDPSAPAKSISGVPLPNPRKPGVFHPMHAGEMLLERLQIIKNSPGVLRFVVYTGSVTFV